MEDLVLHFAQSEFPEVFSGLEGLQRDEFLAGLTLVLHAHRYNKTEGFLAGLDAAIVRDPMYKYSAKSVQRFFAVRTLCFLFQHFAEKGSQSRFI